MIFFLHAGLLPPFLGNWAIMMGHPWSWKWIYRHIHKTKPPRKSVQKAAFLALTSLWHHLLLNSYRQVSEEVEVFPQKSRALIMLFIFFLPERKEKGFWGWSVLEKVQSISVAPEMRQFTALQLLYSQHKKSNGVPISCRPEILLLATDNPYSSSAAELCPPPEIWSEKSLWHYSTAAGVVALQCLIPHPWAHICCPEQRFWALSTQKATSVRCFYEPCSRPALPWFHPFHLLQGCLTIPHQQPPCPHRTAHRAC